jgi:ATP-dependent Clp protease protease subunit
MALDGRSSDVVELVVNSGGGRLADVVPLLDVIGLMRAPVSTHCLGRATGTAAVLVACGTGRRRAAAHAVMSLRCREPEQVQGPPDTLRQQLEELELVRRHIIALLVAATGRPADELGAQLDAGGRLDPPGAAALGLIDPIEEDPAAPDQPNR